MKFVIVAGSVIAGGVLLGLSGCAASKFYQADDPALTSRVWNLPYNDTDDTGPGTKRGVFMDYIDGKPISFTRPGAVLSPGHHRIEVQCYVCDHHMGYAIDRHVIESDLEAGRDYQFDTRPVGLNGCDAWLGEQKE